MDPVTFDLRNTDGRAAAYISDDPTRNVLTLIVTNATSVDLALTAGAPVAEPPPVPGPASLYLNFGDLVPPDLVAHITIEAAGWMAKFFATPSPAFALTPMQNATLAHGMSISFRIHNFPVAGPPRPSFVTVDYYGLGALDPGSGTAAVLVASPPSTHKALNLSRGIVSNPVVYVTVDENAPIANTIVFYLSNPSPTDPVVPNATRWGPNPPEFLLSFVPGKAPGYGALTTVGRMNAMQVGLAQVYADSWSVKSERTGDKPLWRLRPAAHEVLGVGAAATVEFRVTGLVTELAPGLTQMYLQYINVPGYDDGYFAFQLEKQQPSAGILQFVSLTPTTIKRGDPVTLAWQTFAAATLTLSYTVDNTPYKLNAPDDIPLNGSISPQPLPTGTSSYTLEAHDFAGNEAQAFVPVTVIQPLPRVTMLVATPSVANLLDGGRINLFWTVENVGNVRQLTLISQDQSGNESHLVLDNSLTTVAAQVFRSGGASFTLRVDTPLDTSYRHEMTVTVPTWDDMAGMAAPPAGAVTAFSGTAGKLDFLRGQGWLKCDGSSVSKATYPALFDAIGTTYGGDGNPNFAVPDLRGFFLRGVDEGTGRDPDASSRSRPGSAAVAGVGTTQADQLANHHHMWDHFFHDITYSGSNIAVHQAPSSGNLQTRREQATNHDGGGNETRPKNVYVYYLIASGARELLALTQMSDGTILGIGTDNQLYTRRDLVSSWVNVPSSGAVIGVTQLRDGTILGIGTDHVLYTRALATSPWVQVPGSGSVIAVTQLADGRILGVGTDHNLYTRDTLTSVWVAIPSSGSVIGIVRLLDGRLLGVGTDNVLYTRATLTSAWVQIPGSGSVIAVSQLRTGLILGVGTDKMLWERATPESTWVRAS